MTHVLRYLLIYGDRKKKVELEIDDSINDVEVEGLQQKAMELFSLQGVRLQIWDKGFEDWVDLDDGDPVPTNSRIKVEVDKDVRSPVAKQQMAIVASSKSQEGSSRSQTISPKMQVRSPPRHTMPSISHCASVTPQVVQPISSPSWGAASNPPVIQVAGSSQSHISTSNNSHLRSIASVVQQLHGVGGMLRPVPPTHQEPYVVEDTPEVPTSVHVHSSNKHLAMPCHGIGRVPPVSIYRNPLSPVGLGDFDGQTKHTSPPAPSMVRNPSTSSSHQKILNTFSLAMCHQEEPQTNVHVSNNVGELGPSQDWNPDQGQGQDRDRDRQQDQDQDQDQDQSLAMSDELYDKGISSRLVKRGNSQWIYCYQFPDFPVGIVTKMRGGLMLRNSERSQLLDCIYNTVTPHTFYPSTSDYNYLTDKLLDTYPQLYEQAGPFIDRGSKRDVWKQRLMHKFKNKRKRNDRNIPVVQLHKRFRMNCSMADMSQISDASLQRYEVMEMAAGDEEEKEEERYVETTRVYIKEEIPDNSVYHVMAADTTDLSVTGQ